MFHPCDTCGTTVVLGGAREGGRRYCNSGCRERDRTARRAWADAASIEEEVLMPALLAVHEGPCPRCGGPGPVDVRVSYTAYSLMILSFWRERPQVLCRRCGVKANLSGLVQTSLLGWWSFPAGLIVAPVQIVRNVWQLARPADPSLPSPKLEEHVREALVERAAGREARRERKGT